MTTAAHTASLAYLEKVNARDLDGLVALFAPDAQLLHPVGEFAGHDEIRSFYAENVLRHGPTVTGVSWVHEGPTCVLAMEAVAPGSTSASKAIDHLTVDADGRIARLAIYYR
jgi:ketosteroid isomerase-like protein